jgi:hypothetical protein
MSALLLFVVLLGAVSGLVRAQNPPNDPSFVRIGEIYREKNHTPACCDPASLLLPKNFKLDRSYQQQSLNCCGGVDGGARSDIKPTDIPKGIHVSVTGGYYWALPKAPVLIAHEVDDNDHVVQWEFRTPLYCGPGGNGEGCNIRVTVWAKQKK